MQGFLDFISANKSWIFDGIGVLLASWVGLFIWRRAGTKPASDQGPNKGVSQVVTQNVTFYPAQQIVSTSPFQKADTDFAALRLTKSILFIDDDVGFKIVSTLRRSGWKNVDIVADIKRLDQDRVLGADVIFVDIQGVGKLLGFRKEGLGLMNALKERYPEKKVVIYSAVDAHDIFSNELDKADGKLRKTAEAYEFEKTILDFYS